MEKIQGKNKAFESDFVYFIVRCLTMDKRYVVFWITLTLVFVINTYLTGIKNFYSYFANEEVNWKVLIVLFVLYSIIFLISYFKLRLLRFLKNKECKNNERI